MTDEEMQKERNIIMTRFAQIKISEENGVYVCMSIVLTVWKEIGFSNEQAEDQLKKLLNAYKRNRRYGAIQ